MFWFFGHEACGILLPQLGIKAAPPALKGSLNHCTTTEIPSVGFKEDGHLLLCKVSAPGEVTVGFWGEKKILKYRGAGKGEEWLKIPKFQVQPKLPNSSLGTSFLPYQWPASPWNTLQGCELNWCNSTICTIKFCIWFSIISRLWL